jgi:ribosomal protein S3
LAETGNIKLKRNNFNKNLQGNILNFLNLLLSEFSYNISGVKIICCGKWKKTNTGRKQKLYLKLGQIQSSNIANKIVYHSINQTTKYGVCSVKI